VYRVRRILPLTCAAVLALPGAAWAGGAGDDQYQDPFEDPAPAEQQQPQAQPEQQAAPQAGQAPSATPAPQASSGAAAGVQSAAPALPRTGQDAWLAALGGGTLVLAGLALRRRTADGAPD
jgi:LPXTG-motif cell wall-anchored protein